MGKQGAENLTAFPGLNVEDYAQAEQSGVSIPYRVEALVDAVMFLVTFIVDGHTGSGEAAMERPGKLGRHQDIVIGEDRTFHGMHRRISHAQRFKQAFIQLFDKDLRAWANAMIKNGLDHEAGRRHVPKALRCAAVATACI